MKTAIQAADREDTMTMTDAVAIDIDIVGQTAAPDRDPETLAPHVGHAGPRLLIEDAGLILHDRETDLDHLTDQATGNLIPGKKPTTTPDVHRHQDTVKTPRKDLAKL